MSYPALSVLIPTYNRPVIYVVAYPKSGSTWLTRLLGEILNSTTAASTSGEIDIVNQERPGPYLIRRGHYTLVDYEAGPVVPYSHQLAWQRLTDEKIIFLVRDPRDICVSGAWHWQFSIEAFLDRMIRGDVAGCGRWDEYVISWLYNHTWDAGHFVFTRYMDLLQDGVFEMQSILKRLGIKAKNGDIARGFKRQSFATCAAKMGDSEAEMRRNNMRKGIAGDWRNHFTPEMNRLILKEFGWIMEKLGYND